MPKRSGTKQDFNDPAFSIAQQQADKSKAARPKASKNPAAVALGRLGGIKGGVARALSLSSEERSESAKRAAFARWHKKQ
jgi:hypothetical protein